MGKPVLEVSHHKQGCTATEDGKRLEIPDLGNKRDHIYVAKTKALIRSVFTTSRRNKVRI